MAIVCIVVVIVILSFGLALMSLMGRAEHDLEDTIRMDLPDSPQPPDGASGSPMT